MMRFLRSRAFLLLVFGWFETYVLLARFVEGPIPPTAIATAAVGGFGDFPCHLTGTTTAL